MNCIIVYWSMTGNTLDIANKIARDLNIKSNNVNDVDVLDVLKFDKIILGCPAMGAEVLEENEFRPFFNELLSKLTNQTLYLFGSYGWGEGEWMRKWEKEVLDSNKKLGCTGLISNGDSSFLKDNDYQMFIESIKI